MRIEDEDDVAASTPERAMRVVAEILERGGEHALRLNEISRKSRVSVGSIYHHFGSREGLVDATREWLFRQSVPGSIPGEIDRLLEAATPEEFLDRFDRMLEEAETPEQETNRRRRLLVLGAAAGRASHYPGVVQAQSAYIDLYERLVVELQRRTWLPADVDSRMLALYLHALAFGRVFGEFDPKPFDVGTWRALMRWTLGSMMSQAIERSA